MLTRHGRRASGDGPHAKHRLWLVHDVERRLDGHVVPEQVRAELFAQLRIVDKEGVRQAFFARKQAVEQRLQLRRRDVMWQVQLRAYSACAP